MPDTVKFARKYKPKCITLHRFSESEPTKTSIAIKFGEVGAGRVNILQRLAEVRK